MTEQDHIGNVEGGMKLRDYFAASVIGHIVCMSSRYECTVEEDAKYAYMMADAMILA